jgi:hypothetical protein
VSTGFAVQVCLSRLMKIAGNDRHTHSPLVRSRVSSYNPGKNYCGQRVRQTKLYVFLQNLSHSKNSPPPTPNSMLANHLNILLKFKCGKQH